MVRGHRGGGGGLHVQVLMRRGGERREERADAHHPGQLAAFGRSKARSLLAATARPCPLCTIEYSSKSRASKASLEVLVLHPGRL